jgi:tRNA(Ile)-lysidine synthase
MGAAVFDGVKFRWQIGSRGRSPHQIQEEFFDADKIGGRMVLRHWHAGDRFQPIGLKSAAKLQDLFVNAKIPAARRRELVLAVAANGTIFWVEGLRIGEKFKLRPRTKRRLAWNWCCQLP